MGGKRIGKSDPATGQLEFTWTAGDPIPVAASLAPTSPKVPTKIINRAIRVRMYPSPTQERLLVRQAGACRFVWNWALALRNAHYEATGRQLRFAAMCSELTALKRLESTAWLQDSCRVALDQTLRNLDAAFNKFLENRSAPPKFKSRKHSRLSFRCIENVRIVSGKVMVPKIGKVRIRGDRPVDGRIKSATFNRDASGRWYCSFILEYEMPDIAPLPPSDPVGIDFGLKDFAVLSTGERIAAPHFFRTAQRKLRRAQRVLSRRKPGSRRREKAKARVARIHAQIADSRKNFLHKFTTRIVREHDAICVEDLNLSGLARTKLAKSFADASIGEARRQLTYKAEWNRRHLVAVDRFYPSSKTCHACKAINSALTLQDRSWLCSCGATVDRDLNAAWNIRDEGIRLLAAGNAESRNARGARVSLAKASRG